MYLKRAIIENSGPIEWLNLPLEFGQDGSPKPLVLVGANGSGKTNFISSVADSLIEAAAAHYTDILPAQNNSRAWFRIVGGKTRTVQKPWSFTILEFDDHGTQRVFSEKSGTLDFSTILHKLPVSLQTAISWPVNELHKHFTIEEARAGSLFTEGAYACFPSSRSEIPYWYNRELPRTVGFSTRPNYLQRVTKPIYVEQALDSFEQWLAAVIADLHLYSYDMNVARSPEATAAAMGAVKTRTACNQLLQWILGKSASFVWTGRHSATKVTVALDRQMAFPGLDALSSGQSILLGIFGTLLRYGDMAQGRADLDPTSIEGICLVDEIDAHMHINLQHKVLPSLIRMFPKVQFILSSHSPLFVLGMNQTFGADGIQIIELPRGIAVGAETYAEFGAAFNAMKETRAFSEHILSSANASGKPLIMVEGETDEPYLQRAARLLGKSDLLDRCSIQWIGEKVERGVTQHTGKAAMKQTYAALRANPDLCARPILLFYDNDTNSPDASHFGKLVVRRLPTNKSNDKVTAGIENLLSVDCFADEFFDEKITLKPNGDTHTHKSLNKMRLCEHMVTSGTAAQFAAFAPALVVIEDFLNSSGTS